MPFLIAQDNIRDKLTPLEVEMNYQIHENHQVSQQRVRRAPLEPVIDQNRGTTERDAINIQKNCGPDNVCIPDLRLNVRSIDQYLLGSKDLLVFEVDVNNRGEDAFEAGFFMTVPEGINFRKIERVGDSRDTPITCTAPSAATNQTLKCDIGNPLSSGKVAKFKVILLPATKYGVAPKYDFYMEANSTNAEVEGTGFDNIFKKTVDISVETNISVKGVSIDKEILFNTTDFVPLENATKESEIGPQIVHMYEIRNEGPSTIEAAEFFFVWPYETLSHDPLLYLLNQPETTSNVQCEATSFANMRNLEIDRALAAKSFLVSQGAVERSSLHSEESRFAAAFGSNSGYGVGGGKIDLTEEQKRRYDEEDARESTGDASFIHSQRANEAQHHTGDETQQTASSSWNSNNNHGSVTFSSDSNRSAYRANDQGAIVHRAGLFGGSGGSSNENVQRVEDFHSEGTVNQDLSSRSNVQAQLSPRLALDAATSTSRRRMMNHQEREPIRLDLPTSASPYEQKNSFHAGVLELNTLNKDNADDEIRRRGNAAHAAVVASQQQSGSGGGSSSSYQQSGYRHGGQSGQAQQAQSSYSSQSSHSGYGRQADQSQMGHANSGIHGWLLDFAMKL